MGLGHLPEEVPPGAVRTVLFELLRAVAGGPAAHPGAWSSSTASAGLPDLDAGRRAPAVHLRVRSPCVGLPGRGLLVLPPLHPRVPRCSPPGCAGLLRLTGEGHRGRDLAAVHPRATTSTRPTIFGARLGGHTLPNDLPTLMLPTRSSSSPSPRSSSTGATSRPASTRSSPDAGSSSGPPSAGGP